MTRALRLPRLPHLPPVVRVGLKVVVPAGLIALAATRLDLGEVVDVLAGTSWALAAVAVCLLLAGQLVSALRWRQIALGMGLRARPTWFAVAYLKGCLYNTILPTGMGGDAVRVALTRRLGPLGAATRSVAVDRITGLVALAVTAAVLLPVTPELIDSTAVRSLALAAGAAVVLGAVALGAAGRLPGWVPWTVAYEAVWIAGVALLARAVGVSVPLAAIPAVVLVVGVASALPLSVGGTGTREASFVLALAPLGVPSTSAIALGVAFGVALALVGLTGAVLRLPAATPSPSSAPTPLGAPA